MDLDPPSNAPRKVKFKPKAPPKRAKKTVLPKVEKYEDDVDEAKAEHLLRRFNETATRVKPEKKAAPARVAFGLGDSSRSLKSYGSAKGIKDENGKGYSESEERISGAMGLLHVLSSYTFPIRRPYAGNPELLDKEEFGEDPLVPEYKEPETNTAQELGLLDDSKENTMFFLQLPSMLPAVAQSADSEFQEHEKNTNPSKGPQKPQKFCKLESLPEGLIGKMLVYKSGAVKLKIGDTLYDVSAGLSCAFAQDVVAINAEKKHCCNFGEINRRAVVTSDIDSILEAISEIDL